MDSGCNEVSLFAWLWGSSYLSFQKYLSCNDDLDVDENTIYKLETRNYNNPDMINSI